MPDALLAGIVLGCLGGLVPAAVVILVIGLPLWSLLGDWWNGVYVAVWLVGWVVLATLSWRTTGLSFGSDHLIVTRPTGMRRRIPWGSVHSFDVATSTDDDGDVVARWLILLVRRDPDEDVPPAPTTLAEVLRWRRRYFRQIRLGVPLPVTPKDATTRSRRMNRATRDAVTHELTARGFAVPD
jgi:hypothetical protein